jgi:hypothetical protein
VTSQVTEVGVDVRSGVACGGVTTYRAATTYRAITAHTVRATRTSWPLRGRAGPGTLFAPVPNNTRRVECMHCSHAQTIRVRRGRYWTCKKCGQPNPGPAMLESLFRQRAGGQGTAQPPRRRRAAAASSAARDPETGRFLPGGRPPAAGATGTGSPVVPSAGAPTGGGGPAPPARRRAQLGTAVQETPRRPPARRRAAPKGGSDGTASDNGTAAGILAAAKRVWHGG